MYSCFDLPDLLPIVCPWWPPTMRPFATIPRDSCCCLSCATGYSERMHRSIVTLSHLRKEYTRRTSTLRSDELFVQRERQAGGPGHYDSSVTSTGEGWECTSLGSNRSRLPLLANHCIPIAQCCQIGRPQVSKRACSMTECLFAVRREGV
jgi:hypothetical protein